MKTYEVRMRWDDKQAKRIGVTYPGRQQVKETVEARTLLNLLTRPKQ